RGVNAARNASIQQSRYDWCLILDSDDCLNKGSISNIAVTVKNNPGYRSYMFTVDDRIDDMAVLGDRRELTFEDFLLGNIDGDFAHLLDRKLLLNHPFNEELRIYEGLFFLCFFKEAKHMLFVNIVTHSRERNRNDSVTLTVVRFNDTVIRRKIMSANIQLERFGQDYVDADRNDIIQGLYFEIADNELLLGNYPEAQTAIVNAGNSLKVKILKMIILMRSGRLYKWALQRYLSIKHKRPQRDML
ncbi:MAG: hypothetical protein K2I52_04815, partial [Muribaculaceae bacterium]|nr:hypothetical protein [Muribaculaceae bacterium]